jgi:hypothetical protein
VVLTVSRVLSSTDRPLLYHRNPVFVRGATPVALLAVKRNAKSVPPVGGVVDPLSRFPSSIQSMPSTAATMGAPLRGPPMAASAPSALLGLAAAAAAVSSGAPAPSDTAPVPQPKSSQAVPAAALPHFLTGISHGVPAAAIAPPLQSSARAPLVAPLPPFMSTHLAAQGPAANSKVRLQQSLHTGSRGGAGSPAQSDVSSIDARLAAASATSCSPEQAIVPDSLTTDSASHAAADIHANSGGLPQPTQNPLSTRASASLASEQRFLGAGAFPGAAAAGVSSSGEQAGQQGPSLPALSALSGPAPLPQGRARHAAAVVRKAAASPAVAAAAVTGIAGPSAALATVRAAAVPRLAGAKTARSSSRGGGSGGGAGDAGDIMHELKAFNRRQREMVARVRVIEQANEALAHDSARLFSELVALQVWGRRRPRGGAGPGSVLCTASHVLTALPFSPLPRVPHVRVYRRSKQGFRQCCTLPCAKAWMQ